MDLSSFKVYFLGIIFTLHGSVLSYDTSLTVRVEAGKRDCFHQFVKKGDENFEIEYQVIIVENGLGLKNINKSHATSHSQNNSTVKNINFK